MLEEWVLKRIGKIYNEIGGEEKIRELVEEFYSIMDKDPSVATIRKMHSANLEKPKRKLMMYLIGRFGGPPLYVREYGHPRLKARHYPFKIGLKEAEQWLYCMNKAVTKVIEDESNREVLMLFFKHLAYFMVNQPVESKKEK